MLAWFRYYREAIGLVLIGLPKAIVIILLALTGWYVAHNVKPYVWCPVTQQQVMCKR